MLDMISLLLSLLRIVLCPPPVCDLLENVPCVVGGGGNVYSDAFGLNILYIIPNKPIWSNVSF